MTWEFINADLYMGTMKEQNDTAAARKASENQRRPSKLPSDFDWVLAPSTPEGV